MKFHFGEKGKMKLHFMNLHVNLFKKRTAITIFNYLKVSYKNLCLFVVLFDFDKFMVQVFLLIVELFHQYF